jgi:hypothetical protein
VARSVRFRSSPVARSAGTRPKNIAVIVLAHTANSSASPSTRTASRRGRLAGFNHVNARMPVPAIRSPTMPPPAASTRLSVDSWRSSRPRLAPSAPRTAISRSRTVARARSRCATFAHAMTSTNPTAANSARSAGRACFTTSSWSGTTRICMPAASWTACSARSCRAISVKSACACAKVTPGLSRPNTVKNVKLRGGWFA